MELGLPTFFQSIVEISEYLRDTHPNVESYSLNKLFYLYNINDRVRTNKYLDEFVLYQSMYSVINSDDKYFKKNQKKHNQLIKGYQDGRRNS